MKEFNSNLLLGGMMLNHYQHSRLYNVISIRTNMYSSLFLVPVFTIQIYVIFNKNVIIKMVV